MAAMYNCTTHCFFVEGCDHVTNTYYIIGETKKVSLMGLMTESIAWHDCVYTSKCVPCEHIQ